MWENAVVSGAEGRRWDGQSVETEGAESRRGGQSVETTAVRSRRSGRVEGVAISTASLGFCRSTGRFLFVKEEILTDSLAICRSVLFVNLSRKTSPYADRRLES